MPRSLVTPKPGTAGGARDADSAQRAFEQGQAASATDAQRRQLGNVPFLNGVWLKDILIATVATATVAHGLGRIPQGYLATRILGADGRLSLSSYNATTITLRNAGAASITVDVWVF